MLGNFCLLFYWNPWNSSDNLCNGITHDQIYLEYFSTRFSDCHLLLVKLLLSMNLSNIWVNTAARERLTSLWTAGSSCIIIQGE